MGKIKINLVNGTSVEYPLINAFEKDNKKYVILDNEINGSMGLPIILVSKFDNNRLEKIADQNEWQIAKDNLKGIIAGNGVTCINIPSELSADDVFYTQLTLPVPSFDALKKAYSVEEVVLEESNPLNSPIINEENELNNTTPVIDISAPIDNQVNSEAVQTPDAPTTSFVDIETPSANVVESNPVVEPEITPTPIVESPVLEPKEENSSIFKDQKEAFMQACENMFDALVQKFEKELENRK